MKHTWLIYWPTCFNVEKFVYFFLTLQRFGFSGSYNKHRPFPYTKKAVCSVIKMKCFLWSRNLDFDVILIKFLLQSVNFVCLVLRETLLSFNLEHAKLVLLILFCHPNWLSCVTRDAFAIWSYNFLETTSHHRIYKNLIIGLSTLYTECRKGHLTMKTKF